MTLTEFRKIIKGLPGNMDIAIEVSEDSIEEVCGITNVIKVKFNDTGKEKFVFVIKPCSCTVEDAIMDGINMN